MNTPSAIHHFEVNVSDLGASRQFWKLLFEELGWAIFQEWDEGFSFRNSQTGYYLVFVQVRKDHRSAGYNRCRIGLNHLAFAAPDKSFVDRVRNRLLDSGVRMLYDDRYPRAGGGSSYAVFFEDPDRIKVEICCPVDGWPSGNQQR